MLNTVDALDPQLEKEPNREEERKEDQQEQYISRSQGTHGKSEI